MRNFNILARLFARSENAVIGALFTHAIGRPLLVHPVLGEQLLGAYMAGAVEVAEPMAAKPVETSAKKIAILNISGALVSRPMPGLCDEGPQSYEAIRDAFDACMADDSIGAIVLRLQTPGGMASGCFDVTDHIFASRGTKRIIAMVDDYAYSAGYAFAAACDEIWVTRTGGVGSIGVASFHADQSAADAKAGVKITPIYAGAAKIDFNPHFALSDEAKARGQVEVNRLYQMFAGAVSAYRGMSLEAVMATQAETYNGEEAVKVGLADKVGTMRDLMAHLSAEPEGAPTPLPAPAPAEPPAEPAKQEPDPEALKAIAKQNLVVAVLAADLPKDLQIALIKADVVAADITARIEHARAVADLCTAAKLEGCGVGYIERNTPIENVRQELAEAAADKDPELTTTIPGPGNRVGTVASGHWGTTIQRFGGK